MKLAKDNGFPGVKISQYGVDGQHAVAKEFTRALEGGAFDLRLPLCVVPQHGLSDEEINTIRKKRKSCKYNPFWKVFVVPKDEEHSLKEQLQAIAEGRSDENFVCNYCCDVQERSDYSVAVDNGGQFTFSRFCIGCVEAQLENLKGDAELLIKFNNETDVGVKFAGYMQTPELRALLIPIMQ